MHVLIGQADKEKQSRRQEEEEAPPTAGCSQLLSLTLSGTSVNLFCDEALPEAEALKRYGMAKKSFSNLDLAGSLV